jgi:acetyl esterase/lipase
MLPMTEANTEIRVDRVYHNSLHIRRPSQKRAIIYVHGGAFNFRVEAGWRLLVTDVSQKSQALVVIPHYRLAPEYPFPAARSDIVETYKYVLNDIDSGGLGYTPKEVAFMGDSAGGGLIVSVCLQLATLGLPQPSSMYLMSPWVDLSCKTVNISMLDHPHLDSLFQLLQEDPNPLEQSLAAPNGWVRHAPFDLLHLPVWPFDLSGNYVRGVSYGQVRREEQEDERTTYHAHHPEVSPVFAPEQVLATSLPPVLIQIGGKEYLYDEGLLLAKRLSRTCEESFSPTMVGDGIPPIRTWKRVECEVYENMIHVFQLLGTIGERRGRLALDRGCDFLRFWFEHRRPD